MGSTLVGGPTVTNIKPPAPLFPGMTQTYTGALQGSGILPASLGTLTQAAQTGLPTDVGPAFDAMKAAMARSTAEGRTALRESYGARGLSGGTDLFKAGTDFEAQNQANLNNILAQYTMQASEAAAQRRMSAAGAGAALYGEPALAFAPTQVAGQTQGILGGLLKTFSTLFPNFNLGNILNRPPTTIQTPPASTGAQGPYTGTGAYPGDPGTLTLPGTPAPDTTPDVTTTLNYGAPIDPSSSDPFNLGLPIYGDPGAGGTYGGDGGGGGGGFQDLQMA